MNNDDVRDKYIQRATRILRVGETESNAEARRLLRVHKRILRLIQSEYSSISASGVSILNQQIQDILLKYYSDGVIPRAEKIFKEVASREIMWNTELLLSVSPGVELAVNNQRIANRAFKSKYQGKTFTQWYRGLGARKARDITREVANGYANGITTNVLVSSIKNQMNQELRHIKTLTRSAISHAAYEARDELFKANEEFIDEKEWISILDGRTTPYICGVRDTKKYTLDNKPIGHSYLWDAGPGRIHFNCRSTWVPVIKGLPQTVPRPAITAGKEYKRGDKTTRLGTVRKATKPNREKGIFKVQQVTSQTEYENWLRRQPTDFVADSLNSSAKATAFKAGKITLEEAKFFNPAKSKPLTATNL